MHIYSIFQLPGQTIMVRCDLLCKWDMGVISMGVTLPYLIYITNHSAPLSFALVAERYCIYASLVLQLCQNVIKLHDDTISRWHILCSRKPLLSSIDLCSLSDTVKTLGVTLDSKLTFRPPITNLCKFCFYHIRAIRHIRSALTKNMSQTQVPAHLFHLALIMPIRFLWVSLTQKSKSCNASKIP